MSLLTERDFLFGLAVGILILGALAGVQALIERFAVHRRHRPLGQFLLGLLCVTQTAFLVAVANSGATLMLSGFSLYFGLSFLLSFVGFLLMYDAARSLAEFSLNRKFLTIWACGLGLYLLLYFTFGEGLPMRAIWNLPVIVFGFLPIHILLFVTFVRWARKEIYLLLRWGVGLMAFASLILTARDINYIVKLLVYPANFWVIVYFSESFLLLLQLLGIFFLFTGFELVHKHYKGLSS